MFYIEQLCTPSFPIGLVKTESAFIVRLVETSLGRWMVVVAVICVDANPFFGFLTLRIKEQVFSGYTVLPNSKETKPGTSNQETSPSAGKNTGVILVTCLHMEVDPYSYFWWCGYFWGPWASFVMADEFPVMVV